MGTGSRAAPRGGVGVVELVDFNLCPCLHGVVCLTRADCFRSLPVSPAAAGAGWSALSSAPGLDEEVERERDCSEHWGERCKEREKEGDRGKGEGDYYERRWTSATNSPT